MTIQPYSEIRNVSGIPDDKIREIEIFLQGAVYSRVKNQKEWFAARDLIGGDNFDWSSTPLQCLYDYQISIGKAHEEAIDAAGIALGWILKGVLNKDTRNFDCDYNERVARYRWNEYK